MPGNQPRPRPAAWPGDRGGETLDRALRDELSTVPGDNPQSPPLGVFSTRSPNRPNPIGLHKVQILAIDGLRIQVSDLEAIDGTPILDLKRVLDPAAGR